MLWRWIERLASLKLTLAVLLMVSGGVLVSYSSEVRTTWSLAVPLFMLSVNLAAAIVSNPAFRRQTALLMFHLALIAIVLLVAAGRMTYLKGQLELSEGETFNGVLTSSEAGPWHRSRLHGISFVNEGFSIDYDAGLKRGKTSNRLQWIDEKGREQSGVIGDNDPLVLQGYRFYTSPNKGFAPTFVWYPTHGEPVRGTVHLPAYPLHEYKQAQEWSLPGAEVKIWTMLQFDEVIIDPAKPSEFRLPKTHKLVVRIGDERREMVPGDRYELDKGTLVYEGLRSWMGYTVFYDWTIPWLLASCVVAVASLGWHFWSKFASRPWLEPN